MRVSATGWEGVEAEVEVWGDGAADSLKADVSRVDWSTEGERAAGAFDGAREDWKDDSGGRAGSATDVGAARSSGRTRAEERGMCLLTQSLSRTATWWKGVSGGLNSIQLEKMRSMSSWRD
jgi:hypothetical protein